MGNRSTRKDKASHFCVLLLGCGGSGKSTFAKQMQFIHQGFEKSEVLSFKDLVQHNVLSGIKELCARAREMEVESEHLRRLTRYFLGIEPLALPWYTDGSIVAKIRNFWQDPGVQEVYKGLGLTNYHKISQESHNVLFQPSSDIARKYPSLDSIYSRARARRSQKAQRSQSQDPETSSTMSNWSSSVRVLRRKERFHLRAPFETSEERPRGPIMVEASPSYIKTLAYFLADLDRISSVDYEPTLMDILQVHQRTTGAMLTNFVQGGAEFELVDVGGQGTERGKWGRIVGTVLPTAVLFFVAADEYDVFSEEDPTQSRLDHALQVFAGFFGGMAPEERSELRVLVFLNKRDLFAERLKNEEAFQRFQEKFGRVGRSLEECSERVERYVRERAHAFFDETSIHCYWTCALDTESIGGVFDAASKTFCI